MDYTGLDPQFAAQQRFLEARAKEKLRFLQSLGTQELIKRLDDSLSALGAILNQKAHLEKDWSGFLASPGQDCREVKQKLAELSAGAPEFNGTGKKATVAERESWLLTQRTQNPDLKALIDKQGQASVMMEDNRIAMELAREKLANTRAVLALRTAQVTYLGRD